MAALISIILRHWNNKRLKDSETISGALRWIVKRETKANLDPLLFLILNERKHNVSETYKYVDYTY